MGGQNCQAGQHWREALWDVRFSPLSQNLYQNPGLLAILTTHAGAPLRFCNYRPEFLSSGGQESLSQAYGP